jgi:hypothetical protein
LPQFGQVTTDCSTTEERNGESQQGLFIAEDSAILHSAFETIDVICRPSMKLLQALRASTKVQDAACMFNVNGMGFRLLGQAYRADF